MYEVVKEQDRIISSLEEQLAEYQRLTHILVQLLSQHTDVSEFEKELYELKII